MFALLTVVTVLVSYSAVSGLPDRRGVTSGGISIGGCYAKAWRRQRFGTGVRLAGGVAWSALYLVVPRRREDIRLPAEHGWVASSLLLGTGLIPIWVFWSLAPKPLVRAGGRGARFLLIAGLVGVVDHVESKPPRLPRPDGPQADERW